MTNRKWMSLLVGFLIILNGAFISLEVYKEQIRDQWMNEQVLAELAFNELNQLNNWTLMIESILSISILVTAIWLVIKRSNALNHFILINMMTCLSFLVIGSLIAISFETAIFNLVQQLLGPVFILIVLATYQLTKKFTARYIPLKN